MQSDGKLFSPLSALDRTQYAAKLSKRESLKVQKKHYRKEKKRAAKELLSTLKDPSVIVMADWLKVRGTLKGWTKLWCVLKPGLLVLYKSHKAKSGHWVGTVLLNTTELIERPSKKDGFCFKIFHPLDQSIWATKGPKGENLGAITQPLPYSYLIFRAPSEAAGKCWMDALELALRCSSLLMRTMTKDTPGAAADATIEEEDSFLASPWRVQMNESDCERHFKLCELDDDVKTDKEEKAENSESESEHSEEDEKEVFDDDLMPIETPYVQNEFEELGQQGDACQTEEVAEENKSLIWSLVKQVRPGMDLSKVVLPTFILEPRSLLEKFADYYYHADMLSEAVNFEDPLSRMKAIVRWYLAGFYKKPKGLKKPYNPILGETFRCFWKHPKTNTRTFYIAEQISHHPPVTAFYVTNRQDGYAISGSVLAKSKFYGNSLSAIMDGIGRLTLLKRGEDYMVTMPYAHCKGILIGTLTMELGGKVTIDCEKTGYTAELEFKLKPFLGSGESSNRIVGKIKLGDETLLSIDGHWDQDIYIKDKRTGDSELFWSVTPEVKASRLKRYTVPLEAQSDTESEKMWMHVSAAVLKQDQTAATNEKFILEDAQRKATRERKAKMLEWMPRLFERNDLTGDWVYKFADQRPWDPLNDLLQYEHDYIVQTKTRHRTPIVRTMSISNVDDPSGRSQLDRVRRMKRASLKHMRTLHTRGSGSSSPDNREPPITESSDSGEETVRGAVDDKRSRSVQKMLEPMLSAQRLQGETLQTIHSRVLALQRQAQDSSQSQSLLTSRDLFLIAVVFLSQIVALWIARKF
ncbi:hypothetical protein CAPTEDRAFT_166422 [Capitella teleta]|uniref:Oxysterol-binding protein n=1 Tax=Capitella teleta TaxID=283909 RepID=R7TNG6_CAPTE|nr:hypothetical protein CAPTEDRAFT_166422 [Capitella teleta]|eukprot:ELT93091.1 hypothetical protein CAPTEDRAFT_166422 [Capitella teleta]